MYSIPFVPAKLTLPTGMVVRVAIARIAVVPTSRQYRTMFNTDQLEAESSRLEDKIRALANHTEEQVAENQCRAQDPE